jgi:hypothetical protein
MNRGILNNIADVIKDGNTTATEDAFACVLPLVVVWQVPSLKSNMLRNPAIAEALKCARTFLDKLCVEKEKERPKGIHAIISLLEEFQSAGIMVID